MGDVEPMVRIQRDGDGRQRGRGDIDEARQPLHVGMRARHRQRGRGGAAGQRIDGEIFRGEVAEIVLRIDDQ